MGDESMADFQSITGCSEEEAKHFLDAAGGKIDMAVELYFQQASTASDDRPGTSGSSSNGGAAGFSNGDEEIRAPMKVKSGRLVDQSYTSTYAPPVRVTRNSVFDHSRDFRSEANHQRDQMQQANAADDSTKKVRSLAQLFRPPVDIICMESWDTARKIAQREGRWLLVNIQDVQEFACQTLNRDVWSNETVKDFIRSNFIFWQVYNDSPDGQRFRGYYNVGSFPMIGIIDPRTGEMLTNLKVIDAIQFCEQITEFLSLHPTFQSLDDKFASAQTQNPSSPGESSSSSINQNGNGQSASAATSSAPRGKKRTANHNDDEPGTPIHAKMGKLSTDSDQLIEFASSDEHSESGVAEGTGADWKNYLGNDESKPLSLMFNFPSGTREKITVPSDSRLKALAYFIESHGFPFEEFELVLNYPKRVIRLDRSKQDSQLKDLGFGSQEMIHVERK